MNGEEELRAALDQWDSIEGSSEADKFRGWMAAGRMADAIRAALPTRVVVPPGMAGTYRVNDGPDQLLKEGDVATSSTPEHAGTYAKALHDTYAVLGYWPDPAVIDGRWEMWGVALAEALRAAPSTPEPSGLVPPSGAYHWDWCAFVRSRGGSVKCNCGGPQARDADLAAPSTEPALDALVQALEDAYTYEKDEYEPDLPFVDDIEAFWKPFAAKVLARLAESRS